MQIKYLEENNIDKRIFTIPNFITVFRFLLLIPILIFLAEGQKGWAVVLMVTAGLGDMLDGYIARKLNQHSDAGKIIDPIVDKVSVLSIMIVLVLSPEYLFPWWFLVFLFIREILVLFLGFIAVKKKNVVMVSSPAGKVSAFVTGITLFFFIYNFSPYMWIMMLSAVILTINSTRVYFCRYRQKIKMINKSESR